MGKLSHVCSLEQVDRALRLLGEQPKWEEMPNTQRQHRCLRWKAAVSHYSSKCSILVQGKDGVEVERKLSAALEALPTLADEITPVTFAAQARKASASVEWTPVPARAPQPLPEPGEIWHLYVDGACPTNRDVRATHNPAGWGVAVFLRAESGQLRDFCRLFGPVVESDSALSLGAEMCSNNTAELSAFGEALLWLRDEAPGAQKAVLYYDSQYAKKVTTGENVAHKNKDLAKTVQNLWMEVVAVREVELCWVQGHTGDVGNELADKLANEGVKGRYSLSSRRWGHLAGCSEPQAKRARREAPLDSGSFPSSDGAVDRRPVASVLTAQEVSAATPTVPALTCLQSCDPLETLQFGPLRGQPLAQVVQQNPGELVKAIGELQLFMTECGIWKAFETTPRADLSPRQLPSRNLMHEVSLGTAFGNRISAGPLCKPALLGNFH
ncbi:unnamed protein product [Effrenium voratum]|uniref:ribonuclease H n=1 Tax=Effrenium voratum TaxID=2562239 RepID=A0AA36NIC0_9DINO|nr:unnamed protein product [Effrenium voratum]CAJ1431897.1 unnamed protein product [Effrenium voratum]